MVNRRVYKRNNKAIALIKLLRGFKCQICNTTIIKKDGSKYIEAAHIEAKHKKGKETLNNIILLCPNHHKEFDCGKVFINSHDSNYIDFTMSGLQHKLKLI
jgi:predicted restriction endonuclease